jgi:hypothetical protein
MSQRKRVEGARDIRRHYAFAACTEAEYAVIKRFAVREKLTISDFVRRCVNSYLLEEGDDVPLLAEFTKDRA